jgi:hypothetical protein
MEIQKLSEKKNEIADLMKKKKFFLKKIKI